MGRFAGRRKRIVPAADCIAARCARNRMVIRYAVLLALWCGSSLAHASDHADPIDPFNRERLEAGITDLFAFSVLENDEPAFPFEGNKNISLSKPLEDVSRAPLSNEQRSQIDAIVLILCVRRALTQTGSLKLEPYSYRIRLDLESPVLFAQEDEKRPDMGDSGAGSPGYQNQMGSPPGMRTRPTPHEAFLRYGGLIQQPAGISEDLTIEFWLDNKAQIKAGYPLYSGRATTAWDAEARKSIKVASGVYDDPFIFPAFFGTNIVAMAVRIPVKLLPKDQKNFLIWATSHKGDRQVDQVGRSLRTQNPRFELLNTLHPNKHVAAILKEHEHPGLLRDLALRFNFSSTFAYRRWDFVPDVMIYTTQYPVGFPNGRLLTDDVAAMLAQYGDTLLYEISYQHNNGAWPRQNMNDKGPFHSRFPYLLEPFPDKEGPPPMRLTTANRLKLLGIAAALLVALVVENWIVTRWYCRRGLRRQYL